MVHSGLAKTPVDKTVILIVADDFEVEPGVWASWEQSCFHGEVDFQKACDVQY